MRLFSANSCCDCCCRPVRCLVICMLKENVLLVQRAAAPMSREQAAVVCLEAGGRWRVKVNMKIVADAKATLTALPRKSYAALAQASVYSTASSSLTCTSCRGQTQTRCKLQRLIAGRSQTWRVEGKHLRLVYSICGSNAYLTLEHRPAWACSSTMEASCHEIACLVETLCAIEKIYSYKKHNSIRFTSRSHMQEMYLAP